MVDAAALAAGHAPFYYRRHLSEHTQGLSDQARTANQLRLQQDWQHWSAHGELPARSLMEEWAAYAGRGDEFAVEKYSTATGIDTARRDADLQRVWDQDHDERGAMEYAEHLLSLEEAGVDTAAVALPVAADAFDLTGTPDQARGFYGPLLDPAAFNDADPVTAARAWQAAQLWAGADPAAKAAADQLDQQFQTRYGRSPQAQLESAGSAAGPDRSAAGIAVAAAATEERPVPAVFRAGDTDLPVTLVGPAEQSPQDGQWYAPTGQGGHLPVEQIVSADAAGLGYTPAWAGADGTIDPAEFAAAVDQVHAVTPPAADQATAAANSADPVVRTQTSAERARVIKLNEMAQGFYADRLSPGSPAKEYLDSRIGASAVESGRGESSVTRPPGGRT